MRRRVSVVCIILLVAFLGQALRDRLAPSQHTADGMPANHQLIPTHIDTRGMSGVSLRPGQVDRALQIHSLHLSDAPLTFDVVPSVSPEFIDAVLQRESSPLAGLGHSICDQGRRYHIDPVYLLAFVTVIDLPRHLQDSLHNVGHLRASGGEPAIDGFHVYPTWQAGIRAWYSLIRHVYIDQWHVHTLDGLLPIYAPSTDRQDGLLTRMRTSIIAWRLSAKVAP